MSISAFDLFKIGIGPSSSHTVGPMIAANRFAAHLHDIGILPAVHAVRIELYGSLGATGKGHGSDKAVLLGLEGNLPDSINPDHVEPRLAEIRSSRTLLLKGSHPIGCVEKEHVLFFRREALPQHPNGMRFVALDAGANVMTLKEYYSVGDGFVVSKEGQRVNLVQAGSIQVEGELPYPFHCGADLLRMSADSGLTIAALMMENEKHWRSADEIREKMLGIWDVMAASVRRGCSADGELPGPMKVKRRASELHRQLKERSEESLADPLAMLDWVNLYAMAVNEENAAGGRIVTAPTNGAAGALPAVLHYYTRFIPGANRDGIMTFLLSAAAIGLIYKKNASISGAEVGCQGEVGVACSMAAGALAAVLGGTTEQIENAAEIGMEHNLGMTCDPIGGLVQIPYIERNAMGAVKAINAARMALCGNGKHYVSLDNVIKTMMQTGADMKTKYKETSRGGLAVNVIEC
ncbi:L-serine ammonia-lyase [Collimonas sp.]|jgi:L-serine dehydratase|uniref:L-serine ammonia-lyase n=1 Tax=Collimonas sp. TaxID=1963772 RepID=UPI0037C09DD8